MKRDNSYFNFVDIKEPVIKHIRIFTYLFYLIGSLLLTLPLIIAKIFDLKITLFTTLFSLFTFTWNIYIFFLILFVLLLALCFDLFIYHDQEQLKKNYQIIRQMISPSNNIILNLTISISSAYFEEFLFKGYAFFISLQFVNMLTLSSQMILIFKIAIIILLSFVFAILHITQGIYAFILSFIFSIILFITLIITGSIIYAISAHFLFNFIELNVIMPLQIKKLTNDEF